jgi:hypothetical protein
MLLGAGILSILVLPLPLTVVLIWTGLPRT